MAARYSLDGGMIPRNAKRAFDERLEERVPETSSTAVLHCRGRRYIVRLVNSSPSGAMVVLTLVPHIGEQVVLQLPDRGRLSAQVRWVRDGRIGVSFDQVVE